MVYRYGATRFQGACARTFHCDEHPRARSYLVVWGLVPHPLGFHPRRICRGYRRIECVPCPTRFCRAPHGYPLDQYERRLGVVLAAWIILSAAPPPLTPPYL